MSASGVAEMRASAGLHADPTRLQIGESGLHFANIVITSAISVAVKLLNKGMRATRPQVMMKFLRWTSLAKAVAKMPTGRAIMSNPAKIVRPAKKRPSAVTGTR